MLKFIIQKAIKHGILAPKDLAKIKREACLEFKQKMPTDIALLKVYHELRKYGKIKKNERLEEILKTREIRTSSGVAVVTVLTKPWPCPGRCLYCPSEYGMPKSYLKNEPAAQRAFLTKFDPYIQVKTRLDALKMTGHPTDKIELIVLGGTWSAYPKNYQYWFVSECFRACNSSTDYGLRSTARIQLKKQQYKNETAQHRIIGLTLETRPDYVNLQEIKRLRDLGCTRVELGVQCIYDDILKKNLRGHNVADTVRATKLLKDAGFKINYHMMLNLPGSNIRRDEKMFKELFSNQNFQPDLLKIYPCVVLKTAPLYKIWKQGGYKPYSEKQLITLIMRIKKIIPSYVRIQRIIRDIPGESIVAGSKLTNLRQVIHNLAQPSPPQTRRGLGGGDDFKNLICKCIRCREIRGQYLPTDKIKFFRRKYEASGGKEIFLSYESPDQKKLYALLRLRIPDNNSQTLPVLKDSALIRELHTYGQLAPITNNQKTITKDYAQHKGLGKQLMAEAEKIVKKETKLKSVAVISGIGVRRYYKNLGYKLKDEYMIKDLK